MDELKPVLVKMKSTNFGIGHYYIGLCAEVNQVPLVLSSTCQIREILITQKAPTGEQTQVIDYAVMPDDLTTEGEVEFEGNEILWRKLVDKSHKLYHLWTQAISGYNAARAGLVLPKDQRATIQGVN